MNSGDTFPLSMDGRVEARNESSVGSQPGLPIVKYFACCQPARPPSGRAGVGVRGRGPSHRRPVLTVVTRGGKHEVRPTGRVDTLLDVRHISGMDSPVAVVTGAGRGLGSAIAVELAARGCAVALAGRTESHLTDVVDRISRAGGRAIAIPSDVTDAGSVADLFASTISTFGGLDVVVNNAGIATQVPLTELTEDEWQRIFDTNVRGMFLCNREAARYFSTVGGGRSINVASVFGLLGRAGFTAYGASKGAVINFTRAAAAEWARFDAQMNAVAPGYFATDINADLRADDAAMAKVLRRIPAHRMGDPGELANVVTYLALDAPNFLTGQIIAVDGGESSV